MAYSVSTDIINALSSDTVAQLTDDTDGTTIDQSILTETIANADSFINSYLRQQHSVPISPVPAMVKTLSIQVASKYLFDRRTHAEDSQVKDNYEKALEKLKQIAEHSLQIDDDDSVASQGTFWRANKDSDDQTYTDDELDKFI